MENSNIPKTDKNFVVIPFDEYKNKIIEILDMITAICFIMDNKKDLSQKERIEMTRRLWEYKKLLRNKYKFKKSINFGY